MSPGEDDALLSSREQFAFCMQLALLVLLVMLTSAALAVWFAQKV